MYRENSRYQYNTNRENSCVKSRSEKISEAKRAFEGYPTSFQDEKIPAADKKKHPFGLLRLMTAGMLFLILGIAFYNNFSYNGFDKDYVIEHLNKSEYWDNIVKNAGDVANKIVGWYNSLED